MDQKEKWEFEIVQTYSTTIEPYTTSTSRPVGIRFDVITTGGGSFVLLAITIGYGIVV